MGGKKLDDHVAWRIGRWVNAGLSGLRQAVRTAAAQQRDGGWVRWPAAVLGQAAALHQLGASARRQALAQGGELASSPVRQGPGPMLSPPSIGARPRPHGRSSRGRPPWAASADQRQVGGAAAHVQHQHQAAVRQLRRELSPRSTSQS